MKDVFISKKLKNKEKIHSMERIGINRLSYLFKSLNLANLFSIKS